MRFIIHQIFLLFASLGLKVTFFSNIKSFLGFLLPEIWRLEGSGGNWREVRISFSWNIRKTFFYENIRKAFFWENIRIFLMLELETSVSRNIKIFFFFPLILRLITCWLSQKHKQQLFLNIMAYVTFWHRRR